MTEEIYQAPKSNLTNEMERVTGPFNRLLNPQMFVKVPRRLLVLLMLSALGALRWLAPPGPNVILPSLTLAVILLLALLVLRSSRIAAIALALFLFAEGGYHLFLALQTAITFKHSLFHSPNILIPAIFFSSLWLCTAGYLLFSPTMREFLSSAKAGR